MEDLRYDQKAQEWQLNRPCGETVFSTAAEHQLLNQHQQEVS